MTRVWSKAVHRVLKLFKTKMCDVYTFERFAPFHAYSVPFQLLACNYVSLNVRQNLSKKFGDYAYEIATVCYYCLLCTYVFT